MQWGSEVVKIHSAHKHTKDILEEALLHCFLSTVLQEEMIWGNQIWKFRHHVFGAAVLFVFHWLLSMLQPPLQPPSGCNFFVVVIVDLLKADLSIYLSMLWFAVFTYTENTQKRSKYPDYNIVMSIFLSIFCSVYLFMNLGHVIGYGKCKY